MNPTNVKPTDSRKLFWVVVALWLGGLATPLHAIDEVRILHQGESRTYLEPWGFAQQADGKKQFQAKAVFINNPNGPVRLNWTWTFNGVTHSASGHGRTISFSLPLDTAGEFDLTVVAVDADEPAFTATDKDRVEIVPAFVIKSKRRSDKNGTFAENGTEICGGGIDNAVHLADVVVEPAAEKKNAHFFVFFAAGSGGGGHDLSAFTKGEKEIPARLTTAGGSIEHGDDHLLAVAPDTPFELRSSNAAETVTLEVYCIVNNKLHATNTHTIVIDGADVEVDLPDALARVFDNSGRWLDANATLTFRGEPVPGHLLVGGIAEVEYYDGNDDLIKLEAIENGRMRSLAKYVQVDDGAFFNHDYEHQTSNAAGKATFRYRVVPNQRVSTLNFGAADIQVQDGNAVPADE